MPELTRRAFLKLSAAGTGAAGLTALGFDTAAAVQLKQNFRIAGARESHSVCPYCAVGCALVAYCVGQDGSGNIVNRTEGIAFAGGAAFSSEEGYFATKLMRGLGLVHLEQQARV